MSILSKASLVLTPNAVKEGKIHSIIPSNGNGDMSFVRATTATLRNKLGYIENVGMNMPRLNYDVAGSCPSILLEPQRTNLFLQSNNFNISPWANVGVSISPNSIISPDGLNNGTNILGNGALSAKYFNQSFSVTLGLTYTFSIIAKKGTNDFVQIAMAGTFISNGFANFDLNNGVVGSKGSSVTSNIENFENGWYRCSLTATSGITGITSVTFCLVSSSTSTRVETNTLSTSINVYGSQSEVGAYPTSYNPTLSSAITRNADIISRNNIYSNGLITNAGGTWFIELNNNFPNIRDGASRLGIGNSTSLSSEALFLSASTAGRILVYKAVSGVSTALYNTLSDIVKIAIKWNGTTADVFVNGIKVVSATPFTATILEYFLVTNTTIPIFIKQSLLFPTPLIDSELTQLTTL